jgi:hypothetical protein
VCRRTYGQKNKWNAWDAAKTLNGGRPVNGNWVTSNELGNELDKKEKGKAGRLYAVSLKAKRSTLPSTKLIQEGQYVAEVDIELIETDEGWSPYLSLEDAQKLDDVQDALRKGDLKTAGRLARVYTLIPVRV